MMMKKIAILIPAHNEEQVIGPTLKGFEGVVSFEDVFVVSDGSSDSTVKEAEKYTKNILDLKPNQGKANAINTAIKTFDLVNEYEYIMPMDADTVIKNDFIHEAMVYFDNDYKKEVACVVGKVIGRSKSWITAYRLWEYEVSQTIHKAAQAKENAIIVCPGCATIYRSNIFRSHEFSSDTITEDMDFTFYIHRKKLGKIVYCDKAIVITQDPQNIADFLKQIDRWYTGFWQCLLKHNIPWGGQTLDLEVALLASEGLFNGLLTIIFLALIPYVLFKNPIMLAFPFIFDLMLFLIPTMILTSKRHNNWKLLLYLPNFYMMRFLSCFIFLRSFFYVVINNDIKNKWNKVTRYIVT